MKSELEKEAILNSYKLFLKTFNFKFQIIVQSKKEDLTSHISCVQSQIRKEDKDICMISEQYIEYIKSLNKSMKSSTKNYYIIVESNKINKEIANFEEIACNELNEKYLKIKECLSRCGNKVQNISNKKEIKEILFSFMNSQKFIFE